MNELRRLKYNVEVDWKAFPQGTNALDCVADNVETLRFHREKNSHRGISRLLRLRRLVAFCVNQECVEEIADLPLLETLYMMQLTAVDLRCLGRCRALRHLVIKGGAKIPSLSWLRDLPPLDSLLLENLRLVTDISDVQALQSVNALGIEGSMWTTQRVNSFQPIAQLPRVEAFFLTGCRPIADGLQPLFHLHRLRYLEIAGRFPDADFLALRNALPQLTCDWFQEIDQYGSIKASIKARAKILAAQPDKREVGI
jgi:hypothetical protein